MAGRGRLRVDWGVFWGAALFLAVGGGFAAFGGSQLATTWDFLRDAERLRAEVIANRESCDGDGDCTWWPTLRFTAPGGALREARTLYGASNYGYPEGAEVAILYSPRHDHVRMPGAGNLWLLGAGFLGLGALAMGAGAWLMARMTFTRAPGRRESGSR